MTHPHPNNGSIAMAEELKACPFCRASGEVVERHNPMSKWRWSVDCNSSTCGASGPVEASRSQAIAAWNRRTIDAGAVERVARAICGPGPDEMAAAGNPIGEYAEYPRWMLFQLDARKLITALGLAVGEAK